MTTDPEEGYRQIEAMRPRFAVGDIVRLKAGGDRTFTVTALEDYGNIATIEWQEHEGALAQAGQSTLPVSALVKVEHEPEQMVQAEGPAEGQSEAGGSQEGHAEQGDAVETPPQG